MPFEILKSERRCREKLVYDAGRFKDYHYPNVRAGFASTHPTSTLNGQEVPGDVRETMGFLWLHDHRFDFTAQNVYKRLASFYTLFSDDIDLDTGDETTGLGLPSHEFDIPLILADKAFDPTTGELFVDLFNLDGILGDRYTVNGKIQPFLAVKKRRYRFRILNGAPPASTSPSSATGSPSTRSRTTRSRTTGTCCPPRSGARASGSAWRSAWT